MLNRSGLSSAGNSSGGLGMPRHGSQNYGLSSTNTMTSHGNGSGGFGVPSQGGLQGIELYYKRRTGSASHRQRGKAGAFKRGQAPPLEAIQNTQSSLLAKLGAERSAGHKALLPDYSPVAEQPPELLAQAAQQQQVPRSSSAPGVPASGLSSSSAAAAAAASAVLVHARGALEPAQPQAATSQPAVPVAAASQTARSARKSVRWSENLTKLSPEKTGDPSLHMYTSILAVGGAGPAGAAAPPSANMGTNTGIGGLGPPKINPSTKQSADNSALGGGSIVKGVSLVATIPEVSLIKSMAVGQARDMANSLLQAAAVRNNDGNGSGSTDAPRHRALLEMRRSSSGPLTGSNSDRPAVRPSLSEQLAAISASAGELTASIRAKAGMESPSDAMDPPIVVLPAKAFSVGTLNCRYPSPARFYRNRIEYTFNHPFENSEILMTMYYSDMASTALAAGKLKFKLPRRLTHFPADFNPSNPSHAIVIELGTTAAFNIIREKVMPLIFNVGVPRR